MNTMQKCPKCGKLVSGEEVWKPSYKRTEKLRDGLSIAIKATSVLFGKLVAAPIHPLTEGMFDPRDDRYFIFKCQCGNTWESKTRN